MIDYKSINYNPAENIFVGQLDADSFHFPQRYSKFKMPTMSARVILLFCLLMFSKIYNSNTQPVSWNCSRAWPVIELFLPINLKGSRFDEWRKSFFHSLQLFWPLELSQTKLRLLVDSEEIGGSKITDILRYNTSHYIPGRFTISFNTPNKYYNGNGWFRQQLLMFYADNYTHSEYVGFVDSDCIFLTYVDREDLFADGKPIIKATTGILQGRWPTAAAATFEVLGIPEPMICMSSFPVIIKAQHLADMRDHIQQRFNMTFGMAFKKHLARRYFSQFNIMCAYLYVHKRDEYMWNIHDRNPSWDRVDPSPAYGQAVTRPNSSDGQVAILQIADHARYMIKPVLGSSRRLDYLELVRKGICYSPPFPKPFFPFCSFTNSSSPRAGVMNISDVNSSPARYRKVELQADQFGPENVTNFPLFEDLFRFESVDYMTTQSESTLLTVQRIRMERIAYCNHTWQQHLVEEIAAGLRDPQRYQSGPSSRSVGSGPKGPNASSRQPREGCFAVCLEVSKGWYQLVNSTWRLILDPYTGYQLGIDVTHLVNKHPRNLLILNSKEFRKFNVSKSFIPRWPLDYGNLVSTPSKPGEYLVEDDKLHLLPPAIDRHQLRVPWYHARPNIDLALFNSLPIGDPIIKHTEA